MAAEQGLYVPSAKSATQTGEDMGDGRCVAVTSSGVRCRNQARPGSFFCGLHDKEAAAE